MGLCADEFREFVVRPVLEHFDQWSEAAEALLVATAARESGLGAHLRTANGGGLGVFQVTPQMHNRIWDLYLIQDPDLASKVRGLASQHKFLSRPHAELATNLSYATAIAWMIYCRAEAELPQADDLQAIADFWARHYRPRSAKTDACVDLFRDCYRRYVNGEAIAAA